MEHKRGNPGPQNMYLLQKAPVELKWLIMEYRQSLYTNMSCKDLRWFV